MLSPSLSRRLKQGDGIVGTFAPAGADFATPGVLRWSAERGAELELATLTDPWPTDLGSVMTVHGSPHDGDDVTLFDARVQRVNGSSRTSRIASWTLGVGGHVMPEDRWSSASICPSYLHEWLPDTGLRILHETLEEPRRVAVEWSAAPAYSLALPGATVTLTPHAQYEWRYGPDWCIETALTFDVEPHKRLTIREYQERWLTPLLGFILFAADRPDHLTYEAYADAASRTSIVVLRREHVERRSDWTPTHGRFLFRAEDLPDVPDALARWIEVWHKSAPSIGLFGDVVQEGNRFSPPRFLTLYTAAEGYWRSTKTGRAAWSPRELAQRADVAVGCTGATDEAIALIGAIRRYHAHLRLDVPLSPLEIAERTFDSTRRLHALVQACLLREIGLRTSTVERLLAEHYDSWPLP